MKSKRIQHDLTLPGQLRDTAEAELAKAPATELEISAEKLLHELQVHQIELEMQNEALQQSQLLLETSRDRYLNLYEFAPVGYLTLNREALISEINLTACVLLGTDRKKLINHRFAKFVAPHDGDRWHRWQNLTLDMAHYARGEKATFELELISADGACIHTQLDCLWRQTAQEPPTMHLALVDISALKRAEEKSRTLTEEHNIAMRELVMHVEQRQEDDRKYIAREFHDELGQLLAALRLETSMLIGREDTRSARVENIRQHMVGLLDKTSESIRAVITNLRPASLELGLIAAIEKLSADFTKHTGVGCVLQSPQGQIDLDETQTLAIFRTVQESLTNVTKHADASHVEITLTRDIDALIVEVRDDGKGFDPADATRKKSFGFLGMRERIAALGGSIEITSVPHQGTLISLRMPIGNSNR